MTVSTTTNKVSYIGNGIATTFAIPFPLLEQKHLKVFQLMNDIRSERTDWTVANGNMVFETAPEINTQIVIMREVPFTQETDYRENEILSAETLERNFDKLTMQIQQLKEQADRAVTVDIFDDTDAASLIPSIRQSVSDAATYAQAAGQKAEISLVNAENAEQAANTAVNKATEVSNALASKTDIDGANIISAGTFRTNIQAAPIPTAISTVGQIVQISGTPPLTLPAGGTWLYSYFGYNSVSAQGFSDPESLLFGIAAGGTALGSVGGNRNAGTLNAWRIA